MREEDNYRIEDIRKIFFDIINEQKRLSSRLTNLISKSTEDLEKEEFLNNGSKVKLRGLIQRSKDLKEEVNSKINETLSEEASYLLDELNFQLQRLGEVSKLQIKASKMSSKRQRELTWAIIIIGSLNLVLGLIKY